MKEIASIIEECKDDIPKGSTLQFEFIARFISNNQLMPQFAKELFAQNRNEIEMALKGIKINFVEDIKKQILAVEEKAKSYL